MGGEKYLGVRPLGRADNKIFFILSPPEGGTPASIYFGVRPLGRADF